MLFDDNRLSKRTNNFDLLRLIAAVLVLVGHAPLILNAVYYSFDPFAPVFGHPLHSFGLVVFFVISGFLVTRSWERRPSLFNFMTARILRLYPGLIVAMLILVFIVGPLITKTDLGNYFTATTTYKYLANATLIRITYVLPGVFEGNPIGPSLNGSLWSLPYEFFCYFIVLFVGLMNLVKKIKFIYPVLFVISLVGYMIFENELNQYEIPGLALLIRVFAPFLLYFLAGASLYQLRKLVPLDELNNLMTPKKVHFLEDIPKLATGKVNYPMLLLRIQ